MQSNINSDYNKESIVADTEFWPGDLEALAETEATNYLPEIYISQLLAEYGPNIVSDLVDLTEIFWAIFFEMCQDISVDEIIEEIPSLNILETITAPEWFGFTENPRQGNWAPSSYKTSSRPERQRPAASKVIPCRPWSAYFPFSKSTELLVAYETWIGNFNIGNATILECRPNLLKLKLHIDQWDQFNVPETDAVLTIECNKEGAGNRADVVVNNKRSTDNNVTIHSSESKREIFLPFIILGHQIEKIVVSTDDPDKAKLKFKAAGKEYVLILTKK